MRREVLCAPCVQYTELPIPRRTLPDWYDEVMKLVVGVDEAGRGPLAGPVAVGVVAAPEHFDFLAAFPGLNDSKKLTEKKRERIFAQLEEMDAAAGNATQTTAVVRYHVSLIGHDVIDEYGITYAVREGITKGITELMPDFSQGKVWLDGLLKAPEGYEQETVTGGDALIPVIMLASVAAKVVRDRHMSALAQQYPKYGFERHKGYGTVAHRLAISEYGPCAIHRKTYCGT